MLRLLALLLLLPWACGPREHAGAGNPPLTLVLKPLGALSQEAYPGDEVELRVVALRTAGQAIAAAEHVAAAAGEVVTWSVAGAGSGASIAEPTTLTGADGITSVAVQVGTQPNTTFQVGPSVAGVAADFAFSIRVRPDNRDIELLTPSPVDSVVERCERLRFRLVRPNPLPSAPPMPIAGERLTVTLAGGMRDGARLEAGDGGAAEVSTDLSGVAQVRFFTGGLSGISYDIELCGNASCPGVPPKTIRVDVGARDNGSQCRYFTDCADGYVCDAGACKTPATYCDVDGDCPTGYRCGAGRTCELGSGGGCASDADCANGYGCGAGGQCIPPDGCLSDLECPAGWSCAVASGACVPPAGVDALDVRGDWLTRYHFDISDTLPGFFGALEPVVRFLDLVFRSRLEIDVPIVGDILESLLDQLIAEYVPPWVHTVVTVLGDLIYVFQEMEVEGAMALYQHPTSPNLGTSVSGEEDWLSSIFYIASLCPGGLEEFNADPRCGQVDVVLEPVFSVSYSNNDPTVGVRVDPFTGEVRGADLWLYDRDVELELRQLVNVLLDVVVMAASNGAWYDFEDFLVDLVPCADLQWAVDDLACDITGGDVCSIPGIEAACIAAADAAVVALTQALGDIAVGLQITFDARAVIHDLPAGGRAEVLGAPASPELDAESALIGGTETLWLGGELDADSWWYAIR